VVEALDQRHVRRSVDRGVRAPPEQVAVLVLDDAIEVRAARLPVDRRLAELERVADALERDRVVLDVAQSERARVRGRVLDDVPDEVDRLLVDRLLLGARELDVAALVDRGVLVVLELDDEVRAG
jgi:hypothetical protein